MTEPVETALYTAGTRPRLKAVREFGPILAFVAVYLAVREQSDTRAGRNWDGFVLLVGGFVPVVRAASAVRGSAKARSSMTSVHAGNGWRAAMAGTTFDSHRPTTSITSSPNSRATAWPGGGRGRGSVISLAQISQPFAQTCRSLALTASSASAARAESVSWLQAPGRRWSGTAA